MEAPIWIKNLSSTAPAPARELAFRQLLKEWHRPIYRYCRRMLFSHEDADDVTQETFIQVSKSVDSIRHEAAFSNWLYRIAHRKCLDHLAKTKRSKIFNPDATSESHDMQLARLESDPWFVGDEAEKKLQASIHSLPPRQKEVFVLRYFEDMGYAEMAQILSLSEGSLKASYHHAVQKIKRHINLSD